MKNIKINELKKSIKFSAAIPFKFRCDIVNHLFVYVDNVDIINYFLSFSPKYTYTWGLDFGVPT